MSNLQRVKNLKTKEVFNVFIDGKDTGFKALEKFKNGMIKRYPFYIKDGEQVETKSYGNITCITTKDGKRPKAGMSTSEKRGFGFTRPDRMNKFFYFLSDFIPEVNEVVLTDGGETKVVRKKLFISISDFGKVLSKTRSLTQAQRNEEVTVLHNAAHGLLPKIVKETSKYVYQPGAMTRFFDKYAQGNYTFSDNDVELLSSLAERVNISTDQIIKTKRKIDIIYIEDVIKEFEDLIKQKTETKTLEEKWHQFFKKHSWIFSQVFFFPSVFYKDKVNVGGQDLSGNTDKIVDFLYKNKITNNIAFIEIKTHKTPLITKTPYRKPDVYPVSTKLSGAIVQVMDQKTKMLNSFYQRKGQEDLHSLNSVCVVIAGMSKNLNKGQRQSFELFRESNSAVVIVPFDEVLEKMKMILEIFQEREDQNEN